MNAPKMRVRRFGDPREFRSRAEGWLLQAEAEHNLLLGLARRLCEPDSGYKGPVYLATIEVEGEVKACAFRTPPHKLGLTRMPEEAIPLLVEEVGRTYDSLPAVLGPELEAARFAELWSHLKGVTAEAGMAQRIYQLEKVVASEIGADGHLRPARIGDLELIVEWSAAFASDLGMRPGPDLRAATERKILRGEMWLWEDPTPRSMAAESGQTPNGARIGYVYTPPEWRRRGYAAACVSEVSRKVLASGRRFCFLYSDVSNRSTNALYQRVGYKPVADVIDYRFGDPVRSSVRSDGPNVA